MSIDSQIIGMNDFKELLKSVSPNVTVCVRGRHAVGKSQGVYQAAADLGLPVVERRLSQMTEGDLIGLPVIVTDQGESVDLNNAQLLGSQGAATTFKPCDWLIQACEQPVVLFLDERNRALEGVKQAIFQLCDSRTFYSLTLHPETRVVIAENVGDDYAVQQCDPAEVSRAATVTLEPSFQEWLDYAKDRCHEAVVEFVRTEGENVLEHRGTFSPGKKYPDRRTWVKLNDELVNLNLFEAESSDKMRLLQIMGGAFLGPEVGSKFAKFCRERDKNVSAFDVMKDWSTAKKKLEKVRTNSDGVTEKYIPTEASAEIGHKIEDLLSELNNPSTGASDTVIGDFEAANIAAFVFDAPAELALKLHSAFTKSMTESNDAGSKEIFDAAKNRLITYNSYASSRLVYAALQEEQPGLPMIPPMEAYSDRLKMTDAERKSKDHPPFRKGLYSGETVTWGGLSDAGSDGQSSSKRSRRGRPRKS